MVVISAPAAVGRYLEKKRGCNMVTLDVGRVCMKVAGREGGQICTVVKPVDKNFVIVTGPKLVTGVKRRRCNVEHLEPTEIKLDIKEDATDEEVMEAYKKANVIKKFNLKLPSAAELKAEKTKSGTKEAVKESKKKAKEDENKTENSSAS